MKTFVHNGLSFKYPIEWSDGSRLVLFVDQRSTLQITQQNPNGISFARFTSQYTDRVTRELVELKARLVVERDRKYARFVAHESVFEFPIDGQEDLWMQQHTLFEVEGSIYIFVCTFPKRTQHDTKASLDELFLSFHVKNSDR